jgi:hypothetical protein
LTLKKINLNFEAMDMNNITDRIIIYDHMNSGGGGVTPYSFTLTSTGNGTGVSTLSMEVSEDVTMTLDGTAKFYTNSGGTEGESSTWELTAGEVRTIYLKCPSGTANMTISDVSKLIRWTAWTSGVNAASISGDVSVFGVNLTNLTVTGSNTLTGSVAALTDLTYLRVAGSNTLTGSVAALTDLTTLWVAGSNTITGSVAALTDLTFLTVFGSNTLTGSVAALTDLTYLRVTGSNTLTYAEHIRAVNQTYFLTTPASGSGWSTSDISQALIDNSETTWAGVKVLNLTGEHSSMADTIQGGIWGDFSAGDSPSAVATALKTLVKTLLVTVSLNGVTQPGGSGDGTGFPAGFGDWWRA